ncbi:MAG: N-acetyltransferase [Bacilli bacterium]|nr:N-acetyltransferase [Bacilli bacterium]
MVEIKQVITLKQRRQFASFPLKLYKGNKYYVPVFYGDELKVLRGKSPYEDVSESVFFLAYRDKKVVGRIQGIIQTQFNELHNEKRVRFTRFDSIDDLEVSHALFQAVEAYAKEKGMDKICGPLGYSDFEREGLLIEGFDQYQTFEEQYNYDYYQELIEAEGFVKEADWVESAIKFPDSVDPRIEHIASHILKKNNLHLVDATKYSKKKFLAKYGDGFFDCITNCYKDLYGTVPFTPETRKSIIQNFMPIIDLREVFFICDADEKVVA